MSYVRMTIALLLIAPSVLADGFKLVHDKYDVQPIITNNSDYRIYGDRDKLPDAADPAKLQRLTLWTQRTVTQLETIVHAQPPAGSDKLATSEFYGHQHDAANKMIDAMIGLPVRERMTVLQVIQRDPPRPPKYVGENESLSRRADYEAEKTRYEVLLADFRKRRYLIVMEIPWRSSAALSRTAREEIAKAKDEDKAMLRQRWEARKPRHFVYFFGGDEVAEWKPDQVHDVVGLVRAAGMFCYDGAASNNYKAGFGNEDVFVGLELLLKIVPDPGNAPAAAAPAAPAAPSADEMAAKTMQMAHNYRQAGRLDLARAEYDKIVVAYPDAAIAKEAAQWIEFIDKQRDAASGQKP
ncbi:MAG: hypothetical protein GC162_16975 [Planctomycetes bacterium]|nr:hypothetical protein [Planctomycetota bacterium]